MSPPEPTSPEPMNMDAFAVQFAWSEHGRYFYQVAVIGEFGRTFIVCLDGVQEARWGRCVGSNGRESIGTCRKAIEEWCRHNADKLPADRETRHINLEGIPRPAAVAAS